MLILQRTIVVVLIVASSSDLSLMSPMGITKTEDAASLAEYTLMCEQNKPLSNPKYMCCGNEVYSNTADQVCCCNQVVSTKTNLCCSGVILPKNSDQDACCGRSVFNINTQHCCQGNIIDRLNDDSACCGGSAFCVQSEFCCAGKIHRRVNGMMCCGNKIYDSGKEMCCGSTVHNIIDNIPNERQQRISCCGEDIAKPNMPDVSKCKEVAWYGRRFNEEAAIDSCGDKKFDALKQCCNDGVLTDLSKNTTNCLTLARMPLEPLDEFCCKDEMAGIVASRYPVDFMPLLFPCRRAICGNKFYDIMKYQCALHDKKAYIIPNLPPNQQWCGKPGELSYDATKKICCQGHYVHLYHARQFNFRDAEFNLFGENDVSETTWKDSTYPPYLLNTVGSRDNRCCDQQTYNSDEQICCAYTLIPKSATSACCGNAQYNPETKLCCGTVLYPKNESVGDVQCCGNDIYIRGKESCLNDVRVAPSKLDLPIKGQETWKH